MMETFTTGPGPVKWPECYRAVDLLAVYEDGEWTARCLDLPGVVGQGKTTDDAMRDCLEGLRAALESYVDRGKEIPWVTVWATDLPVLRRAVPVRIPEARQPSKEDGA